MPTRRASLQIFAIVIAVLAFAGVVFEKIGQRMDRRRYPQVGRSIDIGGRSLNIYCSGQGSPTVVFDTFSHMAGFAWSGIQPEAAKFSRACWYDRAGYGWSEPGPSLPTFENEASDLHALLRAASEPAPYVFVTPGDAALKIRVYHARYPSEVRGVVMINPNQIDDRFVEVPDEMKGPWARHFGSFAPRVRGTACKAFPAIAGVGLLRLAGAFGNPRGTPAFGVPFGDQAELDFLSDNSTAARGGGACSRDESEEQVRAAGDLGEVPLVVLSSQNPFGLMKGTAWEENRIKHVLPGLAKLSSRGKLILVDKAVFADAILDAVQEVSR